MAASPSHLGVVAEVVAAGLCVGSGPAAGIRSPGAAGRAEVLHTYGLGTEGAVRAHLNRHRDLF